MVVAGLGAVGTGISGLGGVAAGVGATVSATAAMLSGAVGVTVRRLQSSPLEYPP